jgi:hypothetical protein
LPGEEGLNDAMIRASCVSANLKHPHVRASLTEPEKVKIEKVVFSFPKNDSSFEFGSGAD